MKNVTLGLVGTVLVIYVTVIALSILQVSMHRHELNRAVTQTMRQMMLCYYATNALTGEIVYSNDYVQAEAETEIRDRLRGQELAIHFYACDMEKGLLSMEVSETLHLPSGYDRTICCEKTILSDRKEWQ